MSIIRGSFTEVMRSSDAAYLRGKMGVNRANKFIQDSYNAVHGTKYCGYNNDDD